MLRGIFRWWCESDFFLQPDGTLWESNSLTLANGDVIGAGVVADGTISIERPSEETTFIQRESTLGLGERTLIDLIFLGYKTPIYISTVYNQSCDYATCHLMILEKRNDTVQASLGLVW